MVKNGRRDPGTAGGIADVTIISKSCHGQELSPHWTHHPGPRKLGAHMMDYAGSGGWVEVICGVMFSGKPEELMRRVRRATLARKKCQLFKSHLDERYGGINTIGSHDGSQVQAEPISNSFDLAKRVRPETEVVAIDEVQFLVTGVVEVVNDLANRGVRVIVAGTDMDFRGDPLGPIPQLLATAEVI